MAFILVNQTSHPKVGKHTRSWILREIYWDKTIKAQRQRYICYIGTDPVLSHTKAEQICEEKGLKYDDLVAVNGLEIVSDEEFERRKLARRQAQKEARAKAKAKAAA